MTSLPLVHVVAAIICRGDEVLVCRRAPHVGQAGRWEFPGGKVEPGEETTLALTREIREELDVDICVGELFVLADTDVGDRIISLSCYLVELAGPEPTGSTDHDRLEWIRRGELAGRLWAEPDLPAVALLDQVSRREA